MWKKKLIEKCCKHQNKLQFINRSKFVILFTHLNVSAVENISSFACIKTSFKWKKTKKWWKKRLSAQETTAALISPTYFFLFKVLKICIHEEFCLDSFNVTFCVYICHTVSPSIQLRVNVFFCSFLFFFAYNIFKWFFFCEFSFRSKLISYWLENGFVFACFCRIRPMSSWAFHFALFIEM